MGDFVAVTIAGSIIVVSVYLANLDPSNWPGCAAIAFASGVGCLGYFWLTGDDL